MNSKSHLNKTPIVNSLGVVTHVYRKDEATTAPSAAKLSTLSPTGVHGTGTKDMMRRERQLDEIEKIMTDRFSGATGSAQHQAREVVAALREEPDSKYVEAAHSLIRLSGQEDESGDHDADMIVLSRLLKTENRDSILLLHTHSDAVEGNPGNINAIIELVSGLKELGIIPDESGHISNLSAHVYAARNHFNPRIEDKYKGLTSGQRPSAQAIYLEDKEFVGAVERNSEHVEELYDYLLDRDIDIADFDEKAEEEFNEYMGKSVLKDGWL